MALTSVKGMSFNEFFESFAQFRHPDYIPGSTATDLEPKTISDPAEDDAVPLGKFPPIFEKKRQRDVQKKQTTMLDSEENWDQAHPSPHPDHMDTPTHLVGRSPKPPYIFETKRQRDVRMKQRTLLDSVEIWDQIHRSPHPKHRAPSKLPSVPPPSTLYTFDTQKLQEVQKGSNLNNTADNLLIRIKNYIVNKWLKKSKAKKKKEPFTEKSFDHSIEKLEDWSEPNMRRSIFINNSDRHLMRHTEDADTKKEHLSVVISKTMPDSGEDYGQIRFSPHADHNGIPTRLALPPPEPPTIHKTEHVDDISKISNVPRVQILSDDLDKLMADRSIRLWLKKPEAQKIKEEMDEEYFDLSLEKLKEIPRPETDMRRSILIRNSVRHLVQHTKDAETRKERAVEVSKTMPDSGEDYGQIRFSPHPDHNELATRLGLPPPEPPTIQRTVQVQDISKISNVPRVQILSDDLNKLMADRNIRLWLKKPEAQKIKEEMNEEFFDLSLAKLKEIPHPETDMRRAILIRNSLGHLVQHTKDAETRKERAVEFRRYNGRIVRKIYWPIKGQKGQQAIYRN